MSGRKREKPKHLGRGLGSLVGPITLNEKELEQGSADFRIAPKFPPDNELRDSLREIGIESIMVNCNPETVSTDNDTSNRLYLEPLTFEDVMSIVEK